MGMLKSVAGMANANMYGVFQPMMIPRMDVKSLGFQPLHGFGNEVKTGQESLISTSECT
jgi:hypothetical protein